MNTQNAQQKISFQRLGPRPLGLYFSTLQQATSMQQMMDMVKEHAPQFTEIPKDLNMPDFMAGLTKYQQNTWQRHESKYKVAATFGRVTLFDCGGKGAPILLIPSFINKAYILDLLPDASFVNALKSAGYKVFLLDWHDPAEGNDSLTIETAITEKICSALNHINKPTHLMGYCMGGLLALAAAQLAPKEQVKTLTAIATPWDFSQTETHKQLGVFSSFIEPSLNAMPLVPAETLQTHFFMLDPFSAIRRMQGYATAKGEQLKRLTAIEDWLADGVPLEQAIAKTMVFDWFRDNQTFKGNWQVNGQTIQPQNLSIPVCLVVPQKDRIVPPMSALALATQVGDAKVMMVSSGHIGLMVGRKAKANFYDPLTVWLAAQK